MPKRRKPSESSGLWAEAQIARMVAESRSTLLEVRSSIEATTRAVDAAAGRIGDAVDHLDRAQRAAEGTGPGGVEGSIALMRRAQDELVLALVALAQQPNQAEGSRK